MRRIFASGFQVKFVLSFRWIPSEFNCYEKKDVVSLKVIMTRAKHIFMFLRNAYHVFLRAQTGDKRCFLPRRCSWMMVKLIVNLVSLCLSAGKEEDRETSDESGPLPLPKFARVVSGRRQHRLHMHVDHLMCRDGRSEESLLERRHCNTPHPSQSSSCCSF